MLLRAPAAWLTSVQTPTWVAEGTRSPSSIASLRLMSRLQHNGNVRFIPLKGLDHFTEVRPITKLIANDVIADTGQGTFKTRLGHT